MATQKTLTVQGKRFTANQIDRLISPDNMTNGNDYIVTLNGEKYFANYRQCQDAYFAPVCDRNDANAIALSPDNGMFTWSIWLDFDPPQGVTAAASALGSMTSEAKAAAARENGKRGGRPRKGNATMTTYHVDAEMLGDQATEQDARRMVELLQERGYDVEYGSTLGNDQDAIPEEIWEKCLDILGAEKYS